MFFFYTSSSPSFFYYKNIFIIDLLLYFIHHSFFIHLFIPFIQSFHLSQSWFKSFIYFYFFIPYFIIHGIMVISCCFLWFCIYFIAAGRTDIGQVNNQMKWYSQVFLYGSGNLLLMECNQQQWMQIIHFEEWFNSIILYILYVYPQLVTYVYFITEIAWINI